MAVHRMATDSHVPAQVVAATLDGAAEQHGTMSHIPCVPGSANCVCRAEGGWSDVLGSGAILKKVCFDDSFIINELFSFVS